MYSNITDRIDALRSWMLRHEVSAFIVPSTDPHSGEYVPAHWESRAWLTGFDGSAGTAVITLDDAGLWTDSRYFIQAEEQLQGTGITLFKERMEGTPSVTSWLASVLPIGSVVGVDGWVNTASNVMALKDELAERGLTLVDKDDPFEEIWTDRPPLPNDMPFVLPLEYSGLPCKQKIKLIRERLRKLHADCILISALDEIAWTLNMRGSDVHCNPVFVSYLLIEGDSVHIYINKVKISASAEDYLGREGVTIKEYNDLPSDLLQIRGRHILLPGSTSYALYKAASVHNVPVWADSPVALLKAMKNETEIRGFRKCMERDGVALVRFLMWLEKAVPQGEETEVSIDRKLTALRSEQKDFIGISFDTIAGYQSHGAIVHYEATEESAYKLKPEGWLLLDSGAQYLDGTTDITRTIVLGAVTDEQRKDYTLVLKGFIALSRAVFPKGTSGTQLDVLARQFMWTEGINYGHGTGHGVGHFLNVHEGPHQIRMNYMPAPLLPGMTVTNEPGIYKSGRYGVRIENTMLIVEDRSTEFGVFCRFEPLTLCPIDMRAIDVQMLTAAEKDWLNDYHKHVLERLSPMLNEEERLWLKDATRTIN